MSVVDKLAALWSSRLGQVLYLLNSANVLRVFQTNWSVYTKYRNVCQEKFRINAKKGLECVKEP